MQARDRDRRAGRCVFLPVRYADDFVVLVSGAQDDALAEKTALAEQLRRTTGLELSPEKTRVTAVTDGFEFLGFHVTMRWDKRYGFFPRVEVPKTKAADLRRKVIPPRSWPKRGLVDLPIEWDDQMPFEIWSVVFSWQAGLRSSSRPAWLGALPAQSPIHTDGF
jgi:Reverse transcriptase (RNA-dependent DNA polymerase)